MKRHPFFKKGFISHCHLYFKVLTLPLNSSKPLIIQCKWTFAIGFILAYRTKTSFLTWCLYVPHFDRVVFGLELACHHLRISLRNKTSLVTSALKHAPFRQEFIFVSMRPCHTKTCFKHATKRLILFSTDPWASSFLTYSSLPRTVDHFCF